MGFLHSSLRGFSVLSHLAWSLLVSGGGSAEGTAAHTLHVLLPAKWCSGAGAVLGARAARPGALAAGQMCGHCVGTEPAMASGKPRAGLCLPEPLPAHLPGGRQRAKNPNCCFKMILKRALNADTLDTGMYS